MTKSKRARGGTSASGNSNRGKASGDAASSKSLDRQRQKQVRAWLSGYRCSVQMAALLAFNLIERLPDRDEAPSTPEDGPAQLAGLTFQVCAASPLKKHNCLAAQQITATDSHRHVSSCL